VTIRAKPNLPSLRALATFATLSEAFARANRANFRLTQFSVQTDHVHLIVEASSRDSLIRGLQGLGGRAARALNRSWRRTGKVWNARYHARALTTPREVRNGLVYVLLNFRKHLHVATGTDPRSSATWFEGWSEPPAPHDALARLLARRRGSVPLAGGERAASSTRRKGPLQAGTCAHTVGPEGDDALCERDRVRNSAQSSSPALCSRNRLAAWAVAPPGAAPHANRATTVAMV
jgi:hypothetical protein